RGELRLNRLVGGHQLLVIGGQGGAALGQLLLDRLANRVGALRPFTKMSELAVADQKVPQTLLEERQTRGGDLLRVGGDLAVQGLARIDEVNVTRGEVLALVP